MRKEKFHASGSSTSKWISVPMTPPTLQCGAWMPRVGSDPTSVAEVTLPSGSASDATASHAMAGFARGTAAGCAEASERLEQHCGDRECQRGHGRHVTPDCAERAYGAAALQREYAPVAQLDGAPASNPVVGDRHNRLRRRHRAGSVVSLARMPRAPFGVVLAVAAVTGLVPGPAWTRGPERVDFQRDVQPILRERCYNCHGSSKQQNGFRLDRRRDAMRGEYHGRDHTRQRPVEPPVPPPRWHAVRPADARRRRHGRCRDRPHPAVDRRRRRVARRRIG